KPSSSVPVRPAPYGARRHRLDRRRSAPQRRPRRSHPARRRADVMAAPVSLFPGHVPIELGQLHRARAAPRACRLRRCRWPVRPCGAMTDLAPDAPAPGPGDPAGVYGPFAYLSTPNAPLYRRVMRALMAQKERFTVHVRPEEVSAALAADGGQPVEESAVAEGRARRAPPGWGSLRARPAPRRPPG